MELMHERPPHALCRAPRPVHPLGSPRPSRNLALVLDIALSIQEHSFVVLLVVPVLVALQSLLGFICLLSF